MMMMVLTNNLAFALHKVSGPDYTALSAEDKQTLIWSNVLANSTPNNWPGPQLAEIFVESMCPTLDQKGDELPVGWFGNRRKKLIHSIGSVGKVEFVPRQFQLFVPEYSGIFKGAKYGIVRISLAVEPDPEELNTAPGMGLKFLKDGTESSSLVAMYSVSGQESWNVFANDWSNHIPPVSGLPFVSLGSKFATGTPFIQQVGLSDFAMAGEDGVPVQEDKVVFPYKLVFRPTGSISFPDTYHGNFTDDLASIPEDSVLWDVFATSGPAELGGREDNIGQIVLRSRLVTSYWGDTTLFFRHQDMREDLKLKPEWEEYMEKFAGGLIPSLCPIRNFIGGLFS